MKYWQPPFLWVLPEHERDKVCQLRGQVIRQAVIRHYNLENTQLLAEVKFATFTRKSIENHGKIFYSICSFSHVTK